MHGETNNLGPEVEEIGSMNTNSTAGELVYGALSKLYFKPTKHESVDCVTGMKW